MDIESLRAWLRDSYAAVLVGSEWMPGSARREIVAAKAWQHFSIGRPASDHWFWDEIRKFDESADRVVVPVPTMTKSPAEQLLRLRDQRIKSSNPYAAWLDGYRAALAHAKETRTNTFGPSGYRAFSDIDALDAIAEAAEKL